MSKPMNGTRSIRIHRPSNKALRSELSTYRYSARANRTSRLPVPAQQRTEPLSWGWYVFAGLVEIGIGLVGWALLIGIAALLIHAGG